MDEDNSEKEVENQEVKENSEINESKEICPSESEEETSKEETPKEPEEVKEEEKPKIVPKSKKAKEGSFRPIIFVMLISLVIAGLWDKVDWIKNSIGAVLDPSAGFLLSWNLDWGMVILVFIITVIVTLVQKYATDQNALRELKKEQKAIQAEMKKFKEHPEKLMELQKTQMKLIPKQMKLSMRAIAFTGVPFILFFRWFQDYFASLGDVKFFGIIGSWFLFYLIFALIFGGILRKWLKVV